MVKGSASAHAGLSTSVSASVTPINAVIKAIEKDTESKLQKCRSNS
jgi:hypothetical protein